MIIVPKFPSKCRHNTKRAASVSNLQGARGEKWDTLLHLSPSFLTLPLPFCSPFPLSTPSPFSPVLLLWSSLPPSLLPLPASKIRPLLRGHQPACLCSRGRNLPGCAFSLRAKTSPRREAPFQRYLPCTSIGHPWKFKRKVARRRREERGWLAAQSSRSRSDGQQLPLGADSSPQRGAGIAQRHRRAELLGAPSPAKKSKNSQAQRAITAPAPP